MAMLPALQMSTQVTSDRAALPVLKVLYRNSQQIQSVGGSNFTTLHAIDKLDDVKTYGERGYDVESAFTLMLKYTISEDGRLHGEKYYHTVREEFKTIRPAFRWRQVVGLARVTASAYGCNRQDEHGFRAAGYDDACKLLGVDA